MLGNLSSFAQPRNRLTTHEVSGNFLPVFRRISIWEMIHHQELQFYTSLPLARQSDTSGTSVSFLPARNSKPSFFLLLPPMFNFFSGIIIYSSGSLLLFFVENIVQHLRIFVFISAWLVASNSQNSTMMRRGINTTSSFCRWLSHNFYLDTLITEVTYSDFTGGVAMCWWC